MGQAADVADSHRIVLLVHDLCASWPGCSLVLSHTPVPRATGIQSGLFFGLEMNWRHQPHVLPVVIQNANSFPEICSENMRQQGYEIGSFFFFLLHNPLVIIPNQPSQVGWG